MKKLLLTFSVVIAGCGGGGSDTSTVTSAIPTLTPTIAYTPAITATTSVSNNITLIPTSVTSLFSNTPIDTPLFSETAIELPDLRSIYDSLCGNSVILAPVKLVDLNKDGKKDILLQLWCPRGDQAGKPYNGPVPNKLIVLLQQKDGSFVNDTRAVFGSDNIDMGGIVERIVVNDFNNDGYPDLIFSICLEDGRLPTSDGASNHYAQNVFMTSNNKGVYSFIKQGQIAWNWGLLSVDNERGNIDVVSLPLTGANWVQEVWSFVTSWTQIAIYNWVNGAGTVFFKRKNANQGSQIAVTNLQWPNTGLSLYYKENGVWTLKDSNPTQIKMVQWESWNGGTGTYPVTTVDGKDYIPFDQSEQMCELKLKKDDTDSIAVSLAWGKEIVGGYKGGILKENTSPLQFKSWLVAYNVSQGKLTRNTTFKINNEIQDSTIINLQCGDVNGDGYDDIVLTAPFGPPIIYINNKIGNFNRINPVNIPNIRYYAWGESFIYDDIDGDGILDIIRFPVYGLDPKWGNAPIKYRIYRGNRAILDKDLLK